MKSKYREIIKAERGDLLRAVRDLTDAEDALLQAPFDPVKRRAANIAAINLGAVAYAHRIVLWDALVQYEPTPAPEVKP